MEPPFQVRLIFHSLDKLYFISYTALMEIRRTNAFDKWLKNLSDTVGKFVIDARIRRLEEGVFGDTKHVGDGVFEMRIHHGPGYRVYYTKVGSQIMILLCGGDKSTQRSDIAKAKTMVKEITNA